MVVIKPDASKEAVLEYPLRVAGFHRVVGRRGC